MSKLIKCKDCGKNVSKKAKTCPNCGASTTSLTERIIDLVALVFIAIILLFGIAIYISSTHSYTGKKMSDNYRFSHLPAKDKAIIDSVFNADGTRK